MTKGSRVVPAGFSFKSGSTESWIRINVRHRAGATGFLHHTNPAGSSHPFNLYPSSPGPLQPTEPDKLLIEYRSFLIGLWEHPPRCLEHHMVPRESVSFPLAHLVAVSRCQTSDRPPKMHRFINNNAKTHVRSDYWLPLYPQHIQAQIDLRHSIDQCTFTIDNPFPLANK